ERRVCPALIRHAITDRARHGHDRRPSRPGTDGPDRARGLSEVHHRSCHGRLQRVKTSIRQINAYADLVAAVAAAVCRFAAENVSGATLRDHLCDVPPPWCDPPTREEQQQLPAALDALGGTWRHLAKNRQQLLATMVLMGINRTKLRAS